MDRRKTELLKPSRRQSYMIKKPNSAESNTILKQGAVTLSAQPVSVFGKMSKADCKKAKQKIELDQSAVFTIRKSS